MKPDTWGRATALMQTAAMTVEGIDDATAGSGVACVGIGRKPSIAGRLSTSSRSKNRNFNRCDRGVQGINQGVFRGYSGG